MFRLLQAAFLLALILACAKRAHADSFGLSGFSVYGSHSVTINDGLNETTTCVQGNVGTGGTGAGALILDKCRVAGNLDFTTTPVLKLGSHGAYTGSLVTGALTSVSANMSAVSTSLKNLAPNQTLASLGNSNLTFSNTSTTGGTYVVDVTGSAITTNVYTWNFAAASTHDLFVVNIAGNMDLAHINISLSGISSDNLIFNLTGSSCTARVHKSDSNFSGTILAPGCSLRVDDQLGFDGELYGYDVTVDSGAELHNTDTPPPPPPTPTPEPATLVLLGSALTGVILRRRIR
jgi:choice-of-anchor A domain-containing protein